MTMAAPCAPSLISTLGVRRTHERYFWPSSVNHFCIVCVTDLAVAALQQPRRSGELSQSEQQRLLQLTDDAQRMRERIQAWKTFLMQGIRTGGER